jgi:hypothetical protein
MAALCRTSADVAGWLKIQRMRVFLLAVTTERTNQWATAELRQWSAHSPWRLQ